MPSSALAIRVRKETQVTALFQSHINQNLRILFCSYLICIQRLYYFIIFFFAEFLVYARQMYSQTVLDFDILGKQIMDYVRHSNKTSERRPIISLSEAVPLHPTHAQWKFLKKKVYLVGGLLCLLK